MLFLDLNICTNPDILRVIYFCKLLFKIAMIIIPIFVVIKITINFSKAVCDSKVKIGDALKNSFKKILIVIIILLIPWAVSTFMHIINENTSYESCLDNAKLDTIEKFQQIEDEKRLQEEMGNGQVITIPRDKLSHIKISNISSKGALLNIKVNTNGKKILGYYFSYKNEFPTKENSGYLETSLNNLEIIRLPGISYIWVEDENHKLSQTKTYNVEPESILYTDGTILQGQRLSDFLKSEGTSIEEFNKLIFRSARAAKLYTKEAAATAAVALIEGLNEKYGIRIPYRWGSKAFTYGPVPFWGLQNGKGEYPYAGVDCDGFSHWSFTNGGLILQESIRHGSAQSNYWFWHKDNLTDKNGEVGDVVTQKIPGPHVQIIVGKTDEEYIIAHANGKANGVWISDIPFNSIDKYDYKLVKGDKIANFYPKDRENYPSGF